MVLNTAQMMVWDIMGCHGMKKSGPEMSYLLQIYGMFMEKMILNWDGMEYLIFRQTCFCARMNLTSKPTNGPMWPKYSWEKMGI